MEPKKYEINEKRLIRWLLIATLALLILVLGLQAWRLLFPGAAQDGGRLTRDASGSASLQATEPHNDPAVKVSDYKTAMIEDIQALNPALAFDDLAELGVEELDQLLVTGAPGLPIGIAQATYLAEEYAGTLEVDSITWDADPELDEIPAHYEIELRHITLGDFEYKIDAYTGEVLEGQPNILQSTYVPASGDGAQMAAGGSAASDQAPSAAPKTNAQVPQASASAESSALTSEEAAKAAAFAHAGVAETDATGVRVKSDWEDGVRVYEVEFRANGVEYDYEIEAATGAVRKAEQEWGGGASGSAQSSLIGEEAARNAALTHAGVLVGDASYIKCKLDREDGVQVYEVEFVSGGVEYDYEINASTGAILKAEQDRAD